MNKQYSDDIINQARELRRQGYGYRSITKQLSVGVTWSNVRRWVRDIPADNAHNNSRQYMGVRRKTDLNTVVKNATRKRILIERDGAKCSVCENVEWLGQSIPLEVHHKDGNKHNNIGENVCLVCPNCHVFTDTYKGKNIGRVENGHIKAA